MRHFFKKVLERLAGGTVVDDRTVPFHSQLSTVTSEKRLRQLLYQGRLFSRLNGIPGDVVECGVGRGDSLLNWLYLCRSEEKARKVWGFDSFEGFPEPGKEDEGPKAPREGDWKIDIDQVSGLIETAGFKPLLGAPQREEDDGPADAFLIKGFFSDTLDAYSGDGIALLHIDSDLYQSYLEPLRKLYPKVVTRGVVAFDEYHTPEKWPGAKAAVDEFFGADGPPIQTDPDTGKCFLIKS